MDNSSKKKPIKLIVIGLSLSVLIGVIYFLLWYFYRMYFEFHDWISLVISSLVSIITAIATIVAVLISIWYSNNLRLKEKEERIRKINRIVYFEISECILFIKKNFYEYIRCVTNDISIEKSNNKIIFYDVSSNLKDFIYEIMVYYYDNEEIMQIKRIYDTYIKCMHKNEQTGRIEDFISLARNYVLGEECNELLYKIIRDVELDIDENSKPIMIEKPIDKENLKVLKDFLNKYYEKEDEIKLKEEIEKALEFLKGEIKDKKNL